MELYLLRHAIASDESPTGRDADRSVTDEGRKRLTRVLSRAGQAGVEPSLILTSPFLRTRQTAQLAAEILNCRRPPSLLPDLVPTGSPQTVWNHLREHRSERSIMLVSHLPILGELFSYLLNAPTLKFDFKKSALAAMEIERFSGDPHAMLQWIITPKVTN